MILDLILLPHRVFLSQDKLYLSLHDPPTILPHSPGLVCLFTVAASSSRPGLPSASAGRSLDPFACQFHTTNEAEEGGFGSRSLRRHRISCLKLSQLFSGHTDLHGGRRKKKCNSRTCDAGCASGQAGDPSQARNEVRIGYFYFRLTVKP